MTMLAERPALEASAVFCPTCGQMTNITDRLLIDRRRGVVSYRGTEVRLSNQKLRLCEIFNAAYPKSLTNAQLINQMFGHRYDDDPLSGDNNIKVNISMLRADLAITGARIVNTWGHGYHLELPK